jgi:hypothetical protein
MCCFLAGVLVVLLPIPALGRSPLADSTDVLIGDRVERESSVSVSARWPNDVLVASIIPKMNPLPLADTTKVTARISHNAGVTWSLSKTLARGSADPAVAISAALSAARFLVHGMDSGDQNPPPGHFPIPAGVRVLYNDSPDITAGWTEVQIGNESGEEGHLTVDNSSDSPAGKQYNIYCGWDQGEGTLAGLRIARSTNGGDTWTATNILPPTGAVAYSGVKIQAGRTGMVYATWEVTPTPGTVGDLGFAFSNDGGQIFLAADGNPLTTDFKLGVPVDFLDAKEDCSMTPPVTPGFRNKAVGLFTRPVLAVDRSDTRNYQNGGGDHLYAVWAERQPDGAQTQDTGILIMKGFAPFVDQQGTVNRVTWYTDSIAVVNQDSGENDQWWPWITWDECSGMLAVVFMDSRNFGNQAGAETFVAVAPTRDANGIFLPASGLTWTEVKVSDVGWSGIDCVSTLSDQFYDYIGIAAGDGRVFPVWSDNRTGSFRPYTSPLLLWGIEQPSVAMGFKNNMDGSITAVSSWVTNLDANAGDQVRLRSPSQQEQVSANPQPPPRNHGMEMIVSSCQQGTWSYVVSSRRSQCNFKRESNLVNLRVPFDPTTAPPSTTDKSQGVAWGDYDGDGDLDLYVTNNTGTNRLLNNRGRADIDGPGFGRFVDVTAPPLDDTGPGQGAVWGDYDNDGLLDLCLANGKLVNGVPVANKLFRNTGGGTFANVTSGPLALAEDSRAVTWVDYNNDGKLDLYVVNYDVPSRLLRGDGTGNFVDVSSPVNMNNGTAAAWGDYDNDGDEDLYLVRKGSENPDPEGENKLFQNDGNGTFTEAGFTFRDVFDRGLGQAAAWGDYDNDRYLDLILVNEGEYKLFRNNGGTGLTLRPPLVQIGTAGRGVAWGDYDNDGDLDLFFTNDGPDELLQNVSGNFSQVVDGVLSDEAAGRGVAWGDEDGDGDLDLYYANNTGGNKAIRYTPCNPNHWLHVNLVGAASPTRTVSVSNRRAIGARVRAVVGSLSRIQEVSGGSGRGSQNSLTAEFGLGPSTIVDTLEVRWPGGEMRKEVNVAPDRVLPLQEWIYGIQETSTQFCQGTGSRWRLIVSWQTVVATSNTDVLEIYQGTSCGTGAPPYATRTAAPTQGGLQHSVTFEDACTPGTWKYVIRSSNGTSVAAELCRSVVVNGCPSCGTHCKPPCELE